MNNSDYNDFNNWQNGDENEMNNPNNWSKGFFFYGPDNPAFKKMWENMNKNNDYIENMKDYMNMNDILNSWSKELSKSEYKQPQKKYPKAKSKNTTFSQEDYFKLIEIRGYLAITEQHAHVKALDKLLNQITIVPKDMK